ncbi:hypothetical protein UA08_02793 [Talaromyces atroroseus]|uniref:Acetyltransferase n=1 Tax=Talaromyces atroroseus TaxID=1441469 RepID=A0A225B6T4_TALAT|nr:hypothetical protein UA08_02793 [Talaromyces atroroseus]OKL62575.1 hypothetical protein UA08_02793 [Talaromyces atroroseus]
MTFSPGRVALSVVALSTATGGFIFDWNHTHVFNERWPPHAKFHDGQTMSTGFLLGLSALYYLFRTCNSPAMKRDSLRTATWLLSLNWIAQLSAALYPGSLPVDPEFGGGFPQAYICAFLFLLIASGFSFEHRRLRFEEKRD